MTSDLRAGGIVDTTHTLAKRGGRKGGGGGGGCTLLYFVPGFPCQVVDFLDFLKLILADH